MLTGDKKKAEYKEVKKIFLPMEKVKTLNPVISKDEDTYFISKLMYDSLFEMDGNMTPVENLTKSYSFDKNAGEVHIVLKSGVKFHDNKKLDAEDVLFTITAFKAAGSKSIYKKRMDSIDSADVNGSDEITIKFKDKKNMSLDKLVFPILPEHRYDSVSDLLKDKDSFKPVGSGPYKFKEYNDISSLTLKGFKHYHRGEISNDVSFTVLPDKETAFKLVEADNLSAVISTKADRYALLANNALKRKDFPSSNVEFIGFNTKKSYLKDANMRKAISYAINSSDIADEAYFGSGILNETIYYPGYMGTDKKGDAYPYDTSKAAELFKQCGYEDLNKNGVLEGKDKKELTLTILVNSDDKYKTAAAQSIKKNLEDVKVKADVVKIKGKAYTGKLKSGKYDIYVGGYKFDEGFDARTLLGDVKTNYTGYKNKELIGLMDDLKSGNNNGKAKENFDKIREILINEDPYYCLLYRTYGVIKSPALQADVQATFDNYYKGVDAWICRYKAEDKSNNSD